MLIEYIYSIGNKLILRKYEVWNLGVLTDTKLLYVRHTESIVAKARRKLGIIKWKSVLNLRTLGVLFKALVRATLSTVLWWGTEVNALRSYLSGWQYLYFPALSQRRMANDLFHWALHGNYHYDCDIAIRVTDYSIRGYQPFHVALAGCWIE